MANESTAKAKAKAKVKPKTTAPKWVTDAELKFQVSGWSSQHIEVPLDFKYRRNTQTIWVTLDLEGCYLRVEKDSYAVVHAHGFGRSCHVFVRNDLTCYVLALPNKISSLADLNRVKDELQSLIDKDWWVK